MRKTLACAAWLMALAGTAAADTTYTFSGQFCQGSQSSDREAIVVTSTGIYNSDQDTAVPVFCPIGGYESTTVDVVSARVRVKDPTNGHSLSCKMQMRTMTGTLYESSWKYSCGTDTTNGCATATGSGSGYLGLTWTNPVNSGSSMSNIFVYGFSCSMPPYEVYVVDDTYYYGDTYLLGYEVTQANP